jgi:signal transduction histidine kinase/GAF domain-containing protein
VDLSSGHGLSDPRQASVAYLPPTPRQTKVVLALAAVLLLGSSALGPFAAIPLQQPIAAFIPAIDAIISIADLLTGLLLLTYFYITRHVALWALACGYLCSAVLVLVHAITFPGVLTPTGNIFGGSHTNFKFYLLWHLGLPVAVFAYLWLRNVRRAELGHHTATKLIGTFAFVGALALASAVAGLSFLPSVDPLTGKWMTAIAIVICSAALTALYALRRSALDQWLMIVMLAMILELTITALIGGRGPTIASVGFYTGRLLSVMTSTVVLITMFVDASRLYAGLARAHVLASIIDATQSLSREIELPRLIELLIGTAVGYSGANRGLLILPQDGDYRIKAEARAKDDRVAVTTRTASISEGDCPEALMRDVIQSKRSVVFADALDGADANFISTGEGSSLGQARSILCLPIKQHDAVSGLLYLEHSTAPHVFTPERVQMLELLTSQAAISLENARLYADLKARERDLSAALAQLIEGQNLSKTGTFTSDIETDQQHWSDELYRIYEIDPATPPSIEAVRGRVHPDDLELFGAEIRRRMDGGESDFTFRIVTPKAGVKHLRGVVRLMEYVADRPIFMGAIQDITESKQAEEALSRAHSELAHVARVATLNAMTASIAHEVSQPLSGILLNANTGLRLLAAEPPNVAGAVETARRTIRDANRASEVLKRLRAMFARKEATAEIVDLNDAAREVMALSASELQRRRALVQTGFADGLPSVSADRVQLQQVILNLLLNAADAMDGIEDRPRILLVRTELEDGDAVRLEVRDSGTGIDPAAVEKLFEPFYTTKANGMGIGLSICRSIMETHKGRLWAAPNDGPGATFGFSIPIASEPAGSPGQPHGVSG